MRHVNRPLAILLAGVLSGTGCATAHLKGEYSPQYLPSNQAKEITGTSEKSTLAKGHDWVLFWGLCEIASTDMGKKVRQRLRPDEIITDTEVRNHVSLPGVLLWIVTGGLVSHHHLDLRGRVAYVKEKPLPQAQATPVERERTIVVPAGYSSKGALNESDLFAERVIDQPIDQVSRHFNEAAMSSGLIPVADVAWTGLSSSERNQYRGEVPQNRLEGVSDSSIHTFLITNDVFNKDVQREPQCGSSIPGIVLYEKDGKTHCFYSKQTAKIRMLENSGLVGEGRMIDRSHYDMHLNSAKEFDGQADECLVALKAFSRRGASGEYRGTEKNGEMPRNTERNGETPRNDETTPRNTETPRESETPRNDTP